MKKTLLNSLMLILSFSSFCQITNITKFDLTEKEKTKIVEFYNHCNYSENDFINDLSNDSIEFIKTELDRFIKFPLYISNVLKYKYLRLSDFRLFIKIPIPPSVKQKSAEIPDATISNFAVIVGCDDYGGSSDLGGCTDDAQNIYDALTTVYGYESANIRLRKDATGSSSDDVSSTSVINDLNWLEQQADENDVTLFYFSGHGSGSSTTTCSLVTQSGSISENTIQSNFTSIASERRILLMDACHSGGIRDHCQGDDNFLIAACRASETCQTGSFNTRPTGIGGSVFTSWFVDALTHYQSSGRTLIDRIIFWGSPYNNDPDVDQDGVISLREAFDHAKACTEEVVNSAFHPEMSPISEDIKLGKYYVPKSDKIPPYVQNNEQYFPENPSALIALFFSETVDATTLNNSNIILQGSKSGIIPFSHEYDASLKRIIIDPDNDFQFGEEITLILTTGIKDLKENSLDGDRNGTPGPNYTLKFTVVNFPHDYSVSDIELSNTSPVVDEVVSVCATIKNLGQVSEAQGQSFYLFVDDVQKNSSTTISGLAPGQETVRCFNWTATAGVHKLEIKVALDGDENADNNSASTAVYVGTAGNLLVDGEQNPVKAVTLNPGNTGLYTLQLQNTGSADIIAGVTKTGAQSSWITLTGGSPVTIPKQKTISYEYKIVVPSATAPGDYQGNILFSYEGGAKTAAITFNIKVINFVQGTFTDVIDAATYTIDGANLSTTGLTHYFGSVTFFNLDNDNSTSYPSNLVNPITLSNDQYNRLNQAKWEIYTLDELKGTAQLRLSIPEGTGYKSYTSDASLVKLDILNWFVRGSNSLRISLDYFVVGGATDAWDVSSSQQYLSFSKSAWGKDYSVSSNNLNRWQDGWDYGRVYYTVSNVVKGGDLLLFNNGKQVAVSTISTSDIGKTKYFSITSGEIGVSNYFNIKGDYTDATKATLSNIRLEVNYFDGDPNLKCTKTLSSSTSNINENVTVNLLFENIGSNIADEPRYNDSPLPNGLVLVSGSLSGDPGDIDPGLNSIETYIIKATKPGTYTFGATPVTYQDLSYHNYTTQFNAVTINVVGGNLNVAGELSSNDVVIGEDIVISAVVTENVSNTLVTDAIVECNIKNKTTGTQYDSFYLIYNASIAKYVSLPFKSAETGDYEVQITAQKQNFIDGNQIPNLTFKIVPIPYLTIEPLTPIVDCNAGTIYFTVNSNIVWDVIENEDWLNAFKLNESTIQVDYIGNIENSIITGLINITSDELPDRIVSITQEDCIYDLPVVELGTLEMSSPNCYGASDGTISGFYTVTGEGVSEHGVLLDGLKGVQGSGSGTFNFALEGLPAGTYEFSAYAKNVTGTGTDNVTINISEPEPLLLFTNVSKTSTSITIECMASGGTAPYIYRVNLNGLIVTDWLNNYIFTINGLQPSTVYGIEVSVRDAKGCMGQSDLRFIETDPEQFTDPLEPNNSSDLAFDIQTSTSHNDNALCLTPEDQDWFKFTYNGVEYYFMVKGYYSSTKGSYGITFMRNNNTVQIETYKVDGNTDTYLYLYDSDHASLLASNDDSNGLFSFLEYTFPCTFEVTTTSLVLPGSAGNNNSISILTNSEWYIEYDPDSWFSIDPWYGTGSSTINITYSENYTGSNRTDAIFVGGTCSNGETMVEISQAPGRVNPNNGNTEIYPLTSNALTRRAMPVIFCEASKIQSISVYHNGGSGHVLMGVYSDQTGKPSSQLGKTVSTTVNATEGWQTVELENPVAVTAGQTVWLAWVFENSVGVRYTAGTPGRAMSSQTWSSEMPTAFGTSNLANFKFSVYCSYTPGVDLGYPKYPLTSSVANRRAMPVTFSEGGKIQSISVYHNGGTGNVLLGVYSDQTGKPSSLLEKTVSTTVNATEGWQTVELENPVTVTSGQTVWLAWVFENSVGVRYTAGTPGRAMSTATWSSGMPTAFGTSNLANFKFSVYCTYTPGVDLGYPKYPLTSTVANRRAMPVTFSEAGKIQSISVYHNGGTGHVLLGVYSDQTGKPSSLLGKTETTTVNQSEGWQTVKLEVPVTVNSGQTVWLAWVFENSVGVRYTAGTPGRAMFTATWSSGMPTAFGTSNLANFKFSVYCTYFPSNTVEPKSGEIASDQQFESSGLKVYPNPFSQKLNFEFVSAQKAHAILEIYNLNGQLIDKILDQQVQGGVMNSIEYTPSEIVSGMYIYKLKLDGNISIGKVIYKK
jgi:hypothetical protein